MPRRSEVAMNGRTWFFESVLRERLEHFTMQKFESLDPPINFDV